MWALWPERRHITHGQLLGAGNPSGADELDCYDVACLMWAYVDDLVSATEFTARNKKASDDLRDQLLGAQSRTGTAEDEVAEFRRLLMRGKEPTAESDAQPEAPT